MSLYSCSKELSKGTEGLFIPIFYMQNRLLYDLYFNHGMCKEENVPHWLCNKAIKSQISLRFWTVWLVLGLRSSDPPGYTNLRR